MPLTTELHQLPQIYIVTEQTELNEPNSLRLATASIYGVLFTVASIFAWGWQPELPFQPTAVGAVWGCVFLSGYMLGGIGRGKLNGLLQSVPLAYLSWLGFHSLTDLGAEDCLLLATFLVLGGWGASTWQTAFFHGDHERLKPQIGLSRLRWSIWDIGILTTIVACVVHAAPRLVTPWELMFAVTTALFSGLLISSIACCWVWCDRWDCWGILALLTTIIIGLAIVQIGSPAGLSLWNTIQWALTGPANVIASQGVVVLAVLSVWRLDQHGLGSQGLSPVSCGQSLSDSPLAADSRPILKMVGQKGQPSCNLK